MREKTMKKLNSAFWTDAIELIRECHLSHAGIESKSVEDWNRAFKLLMDAINDERTINQYFASELKDLDDNTDITYSFADILEEYFDYLEENECWDDVISSSNEIINCFAWVDVKPSEYKFRIGNALEKTGRYDEAESFGKKWLEDYPEDLFAAASNVFLLVELKRFEEAEALTEKYLGEDLICDDRSQTIFMAAYRLYELTDNANAKQRVSKKIAEYNKLISE